MDTFQPAEERQFDEGQDGKTNTMKTEQAWMAYILPLLVVVAAVVTVGVVVVLITTIKPSTKLQKS